MKMKEVKTMNENMNNVMNEETTMSYDLEVTEPTDVATEIINGDFTNSFNVLSTRGDFSAREAYRLTRPDDDDAISIGKNCKNAEIEIDKYIIFSYGKLSGVGVGIVIIDKSGKKYATSSTAFIKEFIQLNRLYSMDGVTLDKIKVVYKTSQNKTADGKAMTYPMPLGM